MDRDILERISTASYDEIMESPNKFGFPTFDEYKKTHENWLGRDDDKLASGDKGGEIVNRFARKFIHEIEGYRTSKIEEVERIAKDHGIPIRELEYKPEFLPLGAGKADVLVKWMSKADRLRREANGKARLKE